MNPSELPTEPESLESIPVPAEYDETDETAESYRDGYSRGLSAGSMIDVFDIDGEFVGDPSDEQIRRTAFESIPDMGQASYCNHTLPRIRAIAGFEDSGYGTYQICPNEEARHLKTECVDAWRDGHAHGIMAKLAAIHGGDDQ